MVALAYEAVSVRLDGQLHTLEIAEPRPLVAGQYLSTLALPDADDPAALDVAKSPRALLAFAPGETCGGEPVVALLRGLKDRAEDVASSLSGFIAS